jgi:hypothetical protein
MNVQVILLEYVVPYNIRKLLENKEKRMNNIKQQGLFSPGRCYEPGLKVSAQTRRGEATWYPFSTDS